MPNRTRRSYYVTQDMQFIRLTKRAGCKYYLVSYVDAQTGLRFMGRIRKVNSHKWGAYNLKDELLTECKTLGECCEFLWAGVNPDANVPNAITNQQSAQPGNSVVAE